MGLSLGWIPHAFSLEFRKNLSYRADFWISFLGSAAGEIAIAYFLWKSIFSWQQTATMGGFTFSGLMFYYVLVPFLSRLVRGNEFNFVSQEIYDGTLNRYLVYPIPFFGYKYVQNAAQSLVFALQMLFTLLVLVKIFGVPEGVVIAPGSVAAGLIAAFIGSYVYFCMTSVLEMVAFWADNVWSLVVMLRLTSALLGGSMIPLTLFPAWAQNLSHWLPFEWLFWFPVRTVLGQVGPQQWGRGVLMLLLWGAALTTVMLWTWRRGTKEYSGVGI